MKYRLSHTPKRSIALVSCLCLTMGLVAVIFGIVKVDLPFYRILLICYLFLHAAAMASNIAILMRYMSNGSCEELANKRLALLREIIDLAYAHANHPDMFHKKVCKLVNINNLRKAGVIAEPHLSKPEQKKYGKQEIPDTDYEFYFMLNSGFTPRELSIIYNYANPTSIYVKKYRLKSKIEKSSCKN